MSNFLPNELIARLRDESNFDHEAFLNTHAKGDRITSIRLNPRKKAALTMPLNAPVPWCRDAFYLDERPIFTLDPLYHAGCYYVQEASSMFLGHILRSLGLEGASVRALDLCAAPGGKSTLLNAYLGTGSLVVSNEVIKSRVGILQDNINRWGMHNVLVSNNDPSAFSRLPGYFDLMVVDAPCSGSGMFRKDSGAIDEWSLANVKLCSDRQKRILAESIATLATGGYLVYSTCSYSSEENEDILDWIISEYGFSTVALDVAEAWKIQPTLSPVHAAHGYRFYPHQVQGEGFFVGVLKKTQEQETFGRKRAKPEKSPIKKDALRTWLVGDERLYAFMHRDDVHIFPKQYEDDLRWIQQVLYIRTAGTNIGKWLGKELVPSHELALSIFVNAEINAQELTLAVAQQFLRKENLDREVFENAGSGWCLVRHQGVNLGWVKILSNRINNYYPKESRIVHL
ncbi:methyltransferase RsmF C-terminal domain-like protein [Sphingobacterium griseoflavum]|uniref:rRNA cytosine-C5-methyltransferase n=1 Tax=Sphingobacterium griseoflavum TaxID=1474952 RepID=A0ABQ3HY26_9SPHI|nr:RNA methyltransferase [Sphingobacterium griseoflavum]GHE46231.1 rRNA cytosine-C5-methyltransferase [Sphingobacterium griseoflavum]